MIGKQKIGKTFTPLLNYLFSKEGASLIGGNMVGENVQELAAEFLFSKQLNPRVEKPVYHATLSVPDGEYIPDAKWRAIALDYLEGMGLDKNLFAIIRHTDRDHDHIHIAASRIKLDEQGTCVSDSWNYLRSEKLIQELEEKYDLTPASRSFDKERRSPTTGEHRRLARTGEISTREQLQTALDRATTDSPALALLIDRLVEQGISVKIEPTPGGELGISYKLGNIAFSGTHLGKAYTFKGLQKYRGVTYSANTDINVEAIPPLQERELNEILETENSKPNSDANNDSDADDCGEMRNSSIESNSSPIYWQSYSNIDRPEREGSSTGTSSETDKDSLIAESEDVGKPDSPNDRETSGFDSLNWESVRSNLIENACLPVELIDLLHDRGWIDADSLNRPVFQLRTLAGEYRGTCTLDANGKFSIDSHGEGSYQGGDNTEKGVFWIAVQNNIERAIIASNPVELLSVIALDPDFNKRPTLYLSIDAVSSLPTDFLKEVETIVVGFKGDRDGDRLSKELIETFPQSKRINPGFAGWNAILASQEQETENGFNDRDEAIDRNFGIILD
ncbi:relaxase/mobilization nuclease domain-containing protein [Microcoleus sp. MOSTC5]|uniref:relaxase/mobilization nuclease domain-containing protein n=1 Tax=Microcoleus sp. MOSTC5 TaxID=3055378 RepID=UPI002FD412DB